MKTFHDKVIWTILRIPVGHVTSYGTIAALCGSPRAALMVGRILQQSSAADQLPWQRVINSQGYISIVNIEYPPSLQADLLRQEGVKVEDRNDGFWVDLKKYSWQPPAKVLKELS